MAPKKNFPLRLDPQLYAALERWAEDEFRSVNGHIEFLLRDALLRAGRLPKPGAGSTGNAGGAGPGREDEPAP